VSTAYESFGRVRQKERTRQALLDAARALLAEGLDPSVEAAAARAGVSRTAAYRYFSNQTVLVAAAHPEVQTDSMLAEEPPEDAPARLEQVIAAFTEMVAATEPQQRATLRLSLERRQDERQSLPLRQGRAITWIAEALEPLRGELTDAQLHRLALAIRSACGIESLVWLTDVAGLTTKDATATMRWSAQALLQAAVSGSPPPLPARRLRQLADAG
jgi:AcrR family transcriptional regulator